LTASVFSEKDDRITAGKSVWITFETLASETSRSFETLETFESLSLIDVEQILLTLEKVRVAIRVAWAKSKRRFSGVLGSLLGRQKIVVTIGITWADCQERRLRA
jgi:hypothetical protein